MEGLRQECLTYFGKTSLITFQSPWISALAERSGVPVWMVVPEDVPDVRRQLGWSKPDYQPAILEIGITREKILRIIREAGPDAVHIFTGIKAYPAVQEAMVECFKTGGLRMGLMSECPNRPGLDGAARFLWQKLNHVRFGRHLDFVLGLGEHAGLRFVDLGYRREKLFDFAYYPPLPPTDEQPVSGLWPSGSIRLIHVGELCFRKGIDLVIGALGDLTIDNWFYGLVGCGVDENHFKSLVSKARLESKIAFWGAMPNREAMAALAGADVLILASRMDGYGAVVNEALFRGVPVICSSECGARQLIRVDPALGSVVSSHATLRDALAYWIQRGPRTTQRTARVQELSKCVSPESGADYFMEIMECVYGGGERPTPPWLRI